MLMYSNLNDTKDLDKRYGWGVISEILKAVQANAIQLCPDLSDSDGGSNHQWIVPTVSSSVRLFGDPLYFKIEDSSDSVRRDPETVSYRTCT